ncbi:MAG: mechanosensitive ion channel family protein [Helicobacteraceae bacterium]|jgi:small-conductance mechanosensitive channel|nr:mechanosensitive ion channel family protein [Helicobacteraceae bacterium]
MRFLFFRATLIAFMGFSMLNADLNDAEKDLLKVQLDDINYQIAKLQKENDFNNNIWIKRYNNHRDFLALQTEHSERANEIKQLSNKRDEASKQRKALLDERIKTIDLRIELLKKGENSAPYENLTKIELPELPEVENPFAIISGINYLNDSEKILRDQRVRLESLEATIKTANDIKVYYERRDAIIKQLGGDVNSSEISENTSLLASLNTSQELFAIALGVQEDRFAENKVIVREKIEKEVSKIIAIAIAVGVVFALSIILKLVAKRAVKDANRLFSINRAANIATFIIIVFILLFNYISNILYFVTLLGFISAGIAIAMKDWFMSLLGWLVIVIGGSIHIGDRIRITRIGAGDIIVGDVLEIGLTRIMLFEDITLATYELNRRAGRVLHIPNNYIFTHIFQNYTYQDMQTVWDGIDITITFGSNHKKAQKIAKDIASKHAIGYTDQTRKHYNNLRSKFNFRAVSPEPRVFTFAHTYGVRVSIWYLTNSYATLSLRSVIGSEVIEAFNSTEGISLAYPTYTIGGENQSARELPIAPDL